METRMSLIEMDDSLPAVTQNIPAAAPPPPPPVPTPAGSGLVSQVAKARIEAAEAHLIGAGFTNVHGSGAVGRDSIGPGAIVTGFRVDSDGDALFRCSRLAWEEKPLATESLPLLIETVRAEGRVQVDDVQLSTLRCRVSDGALAARNGGWHVFAPTPRALHHLAGFLAPTSGEDRTGKGRRRRWDSWESPQGLSSMLPWAPPKIRKALVEEFAPALPESRLVSLALKERAERASADAPVCYRIASTKYAAYEVDRGAEELLAAVKVAFPGARTEVCYDGSHARVLLEGHADEVFDLAAGDVFRWGLIWHFDDVRRGSITGQAFVERNRCRNFLILGKAFKELVNRRHVGSVQSISEAVKAAVSQGAEDVGVFQQAWSASRKERILDSYAGDARVVFQGLVGAGLVAGISGNREEQVSKLVNAWNEEPGFTRADVVNAVTRASQGEWYSRPWEAEEAEEAAGELLTVKVNVLQAKLTAGIADYAAWAEA